MDYGPCPLSSETHIHVHTGIYVIYNTSLMVLPHHGKTIKGEPYDPAPVQRGRSFPRLCRYSVF